MVAICVKFVPAICFSPFFMPRPKGPDAVSALRQTHRPHP